MLGNQAHLLNLVLALTSTCFFTTKGLSHSSPELTVQQCLKYLNSAQLKLPSQDARSIICKDIIDEYRSPFPSSDSHESQQLPLFQRSMDDDENSEEARELNAKKFHELNQNRNTGLSNFQSLNPLYKQFTSPLKTTYEQIFHPHPEIRQDLRDAMEEEDYTGTSIEQPNASEILNIPLGGHSLSEQSDTSAEDPGSTEGALGDPKINSSSGISKRFIPSSRWLAAALNLGPVAKRRRTLSINNALVSLSDMLVQRGIDRLNRNRQNMRRHMMLQG